MQDFEGLFEAQRVYTIRKVLSRLRSDGFQPNAVLDYGCGEGRYISVLKDDPSSKTAAGVTSATSAFA